MTESEAKEKKCPFSFNHDYTITCWASKCMAWKFNHETKFPGPGEKLETGYCQLIGKQ